MNHAAAGSFSGLLNLVGEFVTVLIVRQGKLIDVMSESFPRVDQEVFYLRITLFVRR
jgi:hypothetical protein